jgi:hypothetical protein
MKTETRLITPKDAETLLQKNSLNRLVRPNVVLEYSRQMTAGLWKENTGEAIKIASDGTILDGQHRLLAQLKSGISITYLIITDMEREVFPVLDSGSKRTSGDVLFIAGVTSGNIIGGAIRGYYILKIGRVLKAQSIVSSQEILAIYNARKRFWDAAYNMAHDWHKKSKGILTTGNFISLYAYLYDIDNDCAYEFMSKLSEGTNLSKDNPIFVLREKLLFSKINAKFTFLQSVKTALIFKAWNCFRKNTSVRYLSFNPDKEKFPIAK